MLAATNRPDSLDGALRRPGRFDREIEVAAPSPLARRGILQSSLSTLSHALSGQEVHDIADALHGFVAADVVGLCQEAAMSVLRRYAYAHEAGSKADVLPRLEMTAHDLRVATTVVKPSAMREVAVEVPQVRAQLASWHVCGRPSCEHEHRGCAVCVMCMRQERAQK